MSEKKSDKIIVNGITKTEHHKFHYYLKKKFGRADRCEMPDCKSINPRNFQWALKNGHQYSSDKEDYIKMCTSCHRKYDFNENIRLKLKAKKLGDKNNRAKLKGHQIFEIIEKLRNGEIAKDIAREYSINPSTVSDIKRGKRWGSLTGISYTRSIESEAKKAPEG